MITTKRILFALLFCVSFTSLGQVKQAKIGDNPEVMSSPLSAVLELESTDKALLISRVANTATITNPVNGMIIFDLSEKCIKGYQDGVWTGCNFNDFVSVTGKTWMNKNLGASRVATSATDFLAYGDYYQWGRRTDGHEKMFFSASNGYPLTGTTATQAGTDVPSHGLFITNSLDWRNPRNDNLWQGVNGFNNPCPAGFKVPTQAEFQAELTAYSINTNNNAFGPNPFKFPLAGYIVGTTRGLTNIGNIAYYWTSTISGTAGNSMYFVISASVNASNFPRSNALPIRCIKN